MTLIKDKKIAVYGLGLSGTAVCQALIDHGVPVQAWDDSAEKRAAFFDQNRLKDFTQSFDGIDLLIPSAGIPPSNPVVVSALEKGIKVWSDIDILYALNPTAKFIGITGTNGKSTTTALVGHMLNNAGLKAHIGGNIGVAAASLPVNDSQCLYVIEASSYQLHYTQHCRFDIPVCLNITQDHLAWHGTMDHYAYAKQRIFKSDHNLPEKNVAIMGTCSEPVKAMMSEVQKERQIVEISSRTVLPKGVSVVEGALYVDKSVLSKNIAAPNLLGRHNAENMAAAYAVGQALGLGHNDMISSFKSFQGLKHRQQKVAEIGSILFINDSKATNPESTSQALAVYQNIHLILGGKPKGAVRESLLPFLEKIDHVYLIGEAQDAFHQELHDLIPCTKTGDLESAISRAYEQTKGHQGDHVILLSPACASFDQYASFEARGDHFIQCVEVLKERHEI